MNRIASRIMLLGDLIAIAISAFLLAFRSSFEPNLLLDIFLAVFPFLLMWVIFAGIGNAYDLHISARKFIKRNIILWSASITLAQISRVVARFIVSSAISNALWLFIEAIGISSLVITWKLGSYFLYRISVDPEKRKISRAIWSILVVIFLLGMGSLLPFVYSAYNYSDHLYTAGNSPTVEAALVLGAGVWPDGTPSTAMVMRIRAAIQLHETDKVLYIVLSGSDQEVEAMRQLAETYGIGRSNLVLDGFGQSTLDSCINTIRDHGFSIVAVVSQRYHLYRALYLCNAVGIQSIGIIADNETKAPEVIMRRYLREVLATFAGFVQIQGTELRH